VKTAAAISHIAERLAAAGIDSPRREARLILAAALRTDHAGLLGQETVAPDTFESLLQRRCRREPLAYILGRKEFWGLDFEVSPATLIPRPDSETLIEAAIDIFPGRAITRILDLGTGTGCLLLAALHEFPKSFGIGTDVSPKAAALARRNAANLGLSNRAAFLAADWAAPLTGLFDLILSNPPYIPAFDLPTLMPEVHLYEPDSALNGGLDGLAAYRHIISALPSLLAPTGAAILELGAGQAESVTALAKAPGFAAKTRADLANIPRALILRPCSEASFK
jgi:release factor glutamine methyltransferase